MAQIIDGKAIAAEIRREIAAEVAELSSAHNIVSSFPPASTFHRTNQPTTELRIGVATLTTLIWFLLLLLLSQVPGLAVVIVGSRKDSQTYVLMKRKACAEAGIRSVDVDLPEDISEAALVAEVHRLNADPSVHGIAFASN
jgi:5,10-methylene-tetrahydrofolate dehydrogenase/methenyl tetrahydrofolate cyclohydrolase